MTENEPIIVEPETPPKEIEPASPAEEIKVKTAVEEIEPAPSEPVPEPSKDSFLKRVNWQLVGMVLAIKAVVLVFGAASFQVLNNERIKTWHGWLDIWNRWDAMRHTRVEEVGYTNFGEFRADLTIFPLHPWLVRAFTWIFQDTQVSAFLVSGIASVALALLLYKLVRLDQRESVARNSVWFLLIFPTAYFLHINYTESLFLAVTVGCFLAARRGRWEIAGLLGILSCMGRVSGLIIIPALIVEAFQQYRETRRWQWQWLFIGVMPLGFAVYLLLNRVITGEAFAFMAITREKFQKSLSPPWTGIINIYNAMWGEPPSSVMMNGVQEMVFIVLGFVCIFFCGWLLRPAYTVWMALNWLLFTAVGFILSTPRYTLVMFPIFILFAKLAERPVWYSVITVWSLLFFAIFAAQFVRGYWAF